MYLVFYMGLLHPIPVCSIFPSLLPFVCQEVFGFIHCRNGKYRMFSSKELYFSVSNLHNFWKTFSGMGLRGISIILPFPRQGQCPSEKAAREGAPRGMRPPPVPPAQWLSRSVLPPAPAWGGENASTSGLAGLCLSYRGQLPIQVSEPTTPGIRAVTCAVPYGEGSK